MQRTSKENRFCPEGKAVEARRMKSLEEAGESERRADDAEDKQEGRLSPEEKEVEAGREKSPEELQERL
jgi:hypothetical protein